MQSSRPYVKCFFHIRAFDMFNSGSNYFAGKRLYQFGCAFLKHKSLQPTVQLRLYSTVYSVQCIVQCKVKSTIRFTVQSMYTVEYSVQCTVQRTMYSTLYSVQYSVQCTGHSVQEGGVQELISKQCWALPFIPTLQHCLSLNLLNTAAQ